MIILQYFEKVFSFMQKDKPKTHVKCHVCAGTVPTIFIQIVLLVMQKD
ncbi:hypothetical protein QUF81_11200 [Peribacillus simplex]|nr:hypothetical protein [Peribacillus simplex]MDM5293744.1 hypothetical protein [Peribacillus simplex]